MDKYIEAEKRLAELLGWNDITLGGKEGYANIPSLWLSGISSKTHPNERDFIPQWARQDGHAFVLMVEHRIRTSPQSDYATIKFDIDGDFSVIEYSDHSSPQQAVRYGVVQAVIAKLSAASPSSTKETA